MISTLECTLLEKGLETSLTSDLKVPLPFLRQILTFLELACIKIVVSVTILDLNREVQKKRPCCEWGYTELLFAVTCSLCKIVLTEVCVTDHKQLEL